jgi:Carboxypeptidase regulatory-like domain
MTVKKAIIARLLLLLLVAVVMAPSLMAQSLTTGDITGTVTDQSGAVTPNVTVTLSNAATGQSRNTTTSATGFYRFSLLSPGNYNITVQATGFTKAERSVSVNVGQASVSDFKLQVGSTTQTVEVTTALPLVQTDNANLSTGFSQNQIQNQPNGGNDLTYIAQTAPGVTMNTGQGYGNFSANGMPATSNLFTVNGENDMDPYLNLNNSGATNLSLGKNEVQEAVVISSNAYSGQYGQQAGAQVNYVTKSGTNQYHGNVFYEWTGSSLDANDWFNNHNGTPRPFANNNEWGASLGGPIKKDKLFFFVDYEAIQYIVPSSETVYVPTPTFMSQTLANLSATAPAEVALYSRLFNLYTNAKGYNGTNYIPGSCGGVLNTINPAFASNNNCFSSYQATPALPGTEWILPFRIDWNQSQNNQFYFRARIDHGTQATLADPFSPGLSAASKQPAYDGQFGWTHVFGPTATNQFSADLSHYQAIFDQVDPSVFPYSILSTGFNLGDHNNLTSYAFDFPQGRDVTQYQFIDDFSWTKGKHSLKFGANFRRYDISDFTFSVYNNPLIILGDISGNGDGGQTDFYNGNALETIQNFPSRAEQPVALWGIGIYGQDEWKVRPNLTLTLALRLEKNSNPVCQTNCSSLLKAPFNTLLSEGLLSPTTPYNSIINGHNHQIYNGTDAIDVAPRFGFAWSPVGPNTVIRGGFGIFDDAFPAVVGDSFMTNLPGLVPITTFTGSGIPWGDTTTPASPYVAGAASAAAIMSGFDNGASFQSLSNQLGSSFSAPSYASQVGTFHTPYYEQWSLGFQQALGDKASLSVGYVGNHGVHVPVNNPGLNAYGAGFAPFPANVPTQIFGMYQQYSSSGVSNYNGLTSSISLRQTHGLSAQFSYTWSHAMDDVSNGGISATPYNNSQTFGSIVYQLNPACLKCNNYGNADYDVRNSFNGSFVYQMPFKFSNSFANAALGGWMLSENFFWRSGLPLTVIDGNTSIANYGLASQGPNTVANVLSGIGQQSCVNGNSQCLNTAAFGAANLFTTFPNQRRNQYRGPHFFDSDVTVGKNFKLTERFTFNFTTNFYNIFNHPNFANPDVNFADGTFGQIQVTTAPPTGPYGSFFPGLPSGRIIQFAGKIIF